MTFSKIDINNDGLDEILVVGRNTRGYSGGRRFASSMVAATA